MLPDHPKPCDWPAAWAAVRLTVNQQGLSGEVPFTHYMVTVQVGQFPIANFDLDKEEVEAAHAQGKTLEHLLLEHLVDESVLHVTYE
jgi:hypothetical protein